MGGTHRKASHVEAGDTDATRYEVPSHGQAHGSEADKANRRHRFTFPPDCGYSQSRDVHSQLLMFFAMASAEMP
jgi:hypothetical protein